MAAMISAHAARGQSHHSSDWQHHLPPAKVSPLPPRSQIDTANGQYERTDSKDARRTGGQHGFRVHHFCSLQRVKNTACLRGVARLSSNRHGEVRVVRYVDSSNVRPLHPNAKESSSLVGVATSVGSWVVGQLHPGVQAGAAKRNARVGTDQRGRFEIRYVYLKQFRTL